MVPTDASSMPAQFQKCLQQTHQSKNENEKQTTAGSIAQEFDRSFYHPCLRIKHFTIDFSCRADYFHAPSTSSTKRESPNPVDEIE
jgi:hypothetical protein